MKKFLLLLLLINYSVFAQTPLPIFSPNFANVGGWQINGNASVISSSYLRLTPNAGGQAGSAFWKQKVSLPNDFSFSTYFVSRMTPGSRADGMTFCIQQASNSAGSVGGGLGYQGIPGKSIAIEYDIYDNGEVGGNNHIAFDLNGVLHGTTNVVASPVNLADGTNKYNWIEYNGATNVLQVRISNTNIRPANPTLSVTINLATNFVGISDMFFGFTAATGGATAEHAVYSALVAPNSTPLSSTGNYSQGVASITLTSSNAISCTALTSTITVTTRNVNGVGIPTNLVMSSDLGGGTLSAYTLTTNSSGVGTVIFTSNAGTLASNTIRAEEPNVGAYGTVIVTKSGVVPVGGSVSSETHSSGTNSGTLTLTGYSGTITKWQKSVDSGITWTDIINTAATYSYTNQTDGTQFRAVISGGTCTANSASGIISVSFSYNVNVYNSDNVGLLNIPVSLHGKLKGSSTYTLISTVYTSPLGAVSLSSTFGSSTYDFKVVIENLSVPNPTIADANTFVNKILTQSFNAKDYYKFDTNNNNALNISDVFLVFYKISGGISSWTYMMPSYRIFNETEWSSINSSTTNLKGTYPGTQTVSITNLTGGGTANFYLIRTGLKQ